MIETQNIETSPGLVFDVSVGGAPDAPLVLMLHGFCVSRYYWDAQVEALARAGFHAVAPNQRGYAIGARPDPGNIENYRMDRTIGDALDIAAAAGHGRRFHLVGHDWGASLAWEIADRWPEKLASLAILSRPHPEAFARALAMPDGEQARLSQHHKDFLNREAALRLIADNAKWLRTRLIKNGVPPDAIERHVEMLGNLPAMDAALAWYRAREVRAPTRPITVPTLYLWGDKDDTVGRVAAETTADFIAAPYCFEAIAGGGHYAADQFPERVNALLLAHLARHPV